MRVISSCNSSLKIGKNKVLLKINDDLPSQRDVFYSGMQ